jgi:thiol-disulfide isomerase/thioredoxin
MTPWCFLLLALMALLGCDQPSSGDTGNADKGNSAQPAGTAKLQPADVRLKIVDGPGYQAAVDAHQGKVVLVDYWATWCEPCKENFPHIVQLHRQHGDQGLVVLSLSLDHPDEEPIVRAFLAEQQATFDHLLSQFGNSDQSVSAYSYKGAVPLYKLYDRTGALRFHFTQFPEDYENGQDFEELDERVAELLAEKP